MARLVIERHLSRAVQRNDDGSRDSMYDLRVGAPGSAEFAIECVQNTCPEAMLVWKKGPARGPLQLKTVGNWVVELSASCRVDRLRAKLGPLLATLHSAGCLHWDIGSAEERAIFSTTKDLAELGVTGVLCDNPDGNGRVYLSMARPGGMVDPTGADLADWVTKFLASEKRADVRYKLSISGATNRHVCIVLTLNSDLTGPLLHHFVNDGCPTRSPDLPAEVTGVWLLLPSADKGLFWDATGWRAVDASIS